MRYSICVLMVIIAVQAFLTPVRAGGKSHGHGHGHGDTNTTNNYYGSDNGGGGSGNSDNDLDTAGAAIAGAAGVCVRDWSKGMQYCGSWAMIDGDDYDKAVHAFGGGVTTRVDQFALSFYGGVENIDKDKSTYMLTGSINWR